MKSYLRTLYFTSIFLLAGLSFAHLQSSEVKAAPEVISPGSVALGSLDWQIEADSWAVYLPALQRDDRSTELPTELPAISRVNAPFMEEIRVTQGAIFWFGRVTADENYADVRVGYTANDVFVHVNIADRLLWYDTSPLPQELLQWDAVSLYLTTSLSETYRFDGQLSWWEPRSAYQAAWRKSGLDWHLTEVPFTTKSGWRGNAPNDTLNDDGWSILFTIPFSSLGLSVPPAERSTWKIGLKLYDRDDAAGSPRASQIWPEQFDEASQDGWGDLVFGLPAYTPLPGLVPSGTTTIRHKLDGAVVWDGMVGGSTVCGDGLNKWTEWGDANYAGAEQVNVQNQLDIADRPCFSKFYITFPLDQIPSGKEILSAQVTLYQFGNSGGGEWGEAPVSLIQALTIAEDWDETTLTWNNAPLAIENVSRSWVDPITAFPGWPGVPRVWDVSMALSQAYHSGVSLRLVFYSADGPMHTGKYFISSDTGDWNELGRPTLVIEWVDP
jgi:hypothetical protein